MLLLSLLNASLARQNLAPLLAQTQFLETKVYNLRKKLHASKFTHCSAILKYNQLAKSIDGKEGYLETICAEVFKDAEDPPDRESSELLPLPRSASNQSRNASDIIEVNVLKSNLKSDKLGFVEESEEEVKNRLKELNVTYLSLEDEISEEKKICKHMDKQVKKLQNYSEHRQALKNKERFLSPRCSNKKGHNVNFKTEEIAENQDFNQLEESRMLQFRSYSNSNKENFQEAPDPELCPGKQSKKSETPPTYV